MVDADPHTVARRFMARGPRPVEDIKTTIWKGIAPHVGKRWLSISPAGAAAKRVLIAIAITGPGSALHIDPFAGTWKLTGRDTDAGRIRPWPIAVTPNRGWVGTFDLLRALDIPALNAWVQRDLVPLVQEVLSAR